MNMHRQPRAVLPVSESEKQMMFVLKIRVRECYYWRFYTANNHMSGITGW